MCEDGSCLSLDFEHLASRLWTAFRCFKPPSLWPLVTAAWGHSHTPAFVSPGSNSPCPCQVHQHPT